MHPPKVSFFPSKLHSDFVALFWDWFRGEVPVLSMVGDPSTEVPPAAARAVTWGSSAATAAVGGDFRDVR